MDDFGNPFGRLGVKMAAALGMAHLSNRASCRSYHNRHCPLLGWRHLPTYYPRLAGTVTGSSLRRTAVIYRLFARSIIVLGHGPVSTISGDCRRSPFHGHCFYLSSTLVLSQESAFRHLLMRKGTPDGWHIIQYINKLCILIKPSLYI